MPEREIKNIVCAKYEAEVFSFRFDGLGRWAIFTVCEDTGELHVQSDWGSAGYRWNIAALGVKGDNKLKRFLARGDANYVMGKIKQNNPKLFEREFDARATRTLIDECVGDYGSDFLSDEIDRFISDAEDDWVMAVNDADSKLLKAVELWECKVDKDNFVTHVFVNRLLPMFVNHLKGAGYAD